MATSKKEQKPQQSYRERARDLEKQFAQVEPDRIFIPSGSINFDYGLGGGYKTGRIYEHIAWEGGGKTTLALHAVAECQKAKGKVVYIDAEHALDKVYATNIGVNWDDKETFTLFQPDSGEDGFEFAKGMMETGEVRLLVIDSANGMLPRKQMEDPAGSSNLGLHARLLGQEIPKIKQMASKHNTAVIFISQFREKIGVMFGSPETTQGGHALKFWASVRTELRKENTKDGDEVYGIYSKFKVIKNKVASPYRKGKIPIVFGVGIDKLQEVIDLGKEFDLLKTRASGGVNYITYGEEKFPEDTFRELLNDNPDFYNKIKSDITKQLSDTQEEVTPTAEELVTP
jgi:recombination protein RecA